MKQSKSLNLKAIIAAILAAALMTAICGLGWLEKPDNTVNDMLYLREQALDGEIVVIGIDQYALEELGPMPWDRAVFAEIINRLNENPDNCPAVIGIDVLFAGNGANPESDAALAEAVGKRGNVVVAAAATFGSKVIETADGFYTDDKAVLAWDQPFDALARRGTFGHINAMEDADGFIRHGLLYVDVNGQRVYSMPWQIYQKYCEFIGEDPNDMPATNEKGFWYLPYTGKDGAFYDFVSVLDILNGDVAFDYFAGKIVLIGPYAAGMQDEYFTSIEHAETMMGIEIQANQIEAFRNGFYPGEVSNTVQLIILFVICAAAVLLMHDKAVKWSILIWLAGCAVWIGACLALYKGGHILHALWVPLALTIIFIGSVAINYVKARNEKKHVQDAFGRYVDPAIIDEIMVQGDGEEALGGKSFDIAVLFVDIRGFTSMSESLEPATVVEILNKYLTLTTECIMRYHGTLDKFVGDCTMAFWNAPVAQEDPIYLACCAAMDMVDGSKALGQELLEKYGRTVSFGVGVHYGPAVVGNIGAPRRMDFTAIGDTVNTASRLESNAPAGTVYISRIVADALGERAKTTSLGGTIKLKGKTEGFEILTLDDLER